MDSLWPQMRQEADQLPEAVGSAEGNLAAMWAASDDAFRGMRPFSFVLARPSA
jgi:hypothetical protein